MRERPNFILANCIAAASTALAGRMEEAHNFMARLRQIAPDLSFANLRVLKAFQQTEDLDRWTEGLRLAGLPE